MVIIMQNAVFIGIYIYIYMVFIFFYVFLVYVLLLYGFYGCLWFNRDNIGMI